MAAVSRTIRRRTAVDAAGPLPGTTPLLAQLFAQRGVSDAGEVELSSSRLLPPDHLRGVREAAVMLADALAEDTALLIVGDFDADGATSTALAMHMLQAMGARRLGFLVPNRFEYGYGLTPEIVELAAGRKPGIIITVDNGISSMEGVRRAAELGIRTLVTDHHLPGEQLPAAQVIVNPNHPECRFPSKNLAGVGVIFYVMAALRAELRQRNWFAEKQLQEPSLGSVLDLVALGTVADLVPLDHNNRVLVQQGLLRIRAGHARPGIAALLAVAGRNHRTLVTADLGFGVGPRLNAAGRLDDMSLGIACLLANDADRAAALAAQLDALNRDRQRLEGDMQRQALRALEPVVASLDSELPVALCLYDKDWHQGVIGILAARVRERMHRPTIVLTDGEQGEVKGSARSIAGLHIRDVLAAVAARYPGLISRFGGHAMAAGLSLPRDGLEAFQEAFVEQVASQLDPAALEAVIDSDGELPLASLNLDVALELRYAAPWGQQFPEPVFDGEFLLLQQRLVGERHLKLVLAPGDDPRRLLDAIAFRVDLNLWPNPEVQRAQLVYRMDVNTYRGEQQLQLIVEQITPL